MGLCGQSSVRVRKARSCGMGAGCEAWVSSRLAVSSQRWSPQALICNTFISGPSQDASPLPPAVSSGAPGFPPRALSVHRVAPHNMLLGLSCPGKLHVHVTGGRGTLSHPPVLQLWPAPSLGALHPGKVAISHLLSAPGLLLGGSVLGASLSCRVQPGCRMSARMVLVLCPNMLSEPPAGASPLV